MTDDPEVPLTPMEAAMHAFADGRLPPDEWPALLRHLQAHPEDRARLAHWQSHRQSLRDWHRSLDPGELPASLRQALRPDARGRWPWQAAAAVLLLALGGAAGTWWGAHRATTAGGSVLAALPRHALAAHAVYVPEVLHPVEVRAEEEAHLVKWLSKRLGAPLSAPQLQPEGFRLLGGRLLPGEGGDARAQFMYEDMQGRRLTLYASVLAREPQGGGTAFRSMKDGEAQTFYWVDGRRGYALTGQLPREELLRLARVVHGQLGS